jgi:hypothetical protein
MRCSRIKHHNYIIVVDEKHINDHVWSFLGFLHCNMIDVIILNGVLYIGGVLGFNKIINSMSQSGGIPGSSSGKTLRNSLTTGTSDP